LTFDTISTPLQANPLLATRTRNHQLSHPRLVFISEAL
jgi:hypothetical protein